MGLDISRLNELIQHDQRLITLTGAGGKTSLSHWLASFLNAAGKRVIITTTTKIFPPSRGHIILQADGQDFMKRIRTALNISPSITVARDFDHESGKLLGLKRKEVSALHKSRLADVILVEGDGADRKPLKAPAEHEPVIPIETELCIGVMGIDAVYRRLSENSVHRSLIFAVLTGAVRRDVIRPEHLISLAEAKNGLFKDSPAGSRKAVFLNKTDSPDGMQLADEFARLLAKPLKLKIKWFAGSVRNKEIFTFSQPTPAVQPEQEMQPAFPQ